MIDMSTHKPECEIRPKYMTCICIDIERAEKRIMESQATLWSSTSEQVRNAYGRGYRDALHDVHDAICSVVPPDERRAAISEINALLADAAGE